MQCTVNGKSIFLDACLVAFYWFVANLTIEKEPRKIAYKNPNKIAFGFEINEILPC
jgi:hypothetical protein